MKKLILCLLLICCFASVSIAGESNVPDSEEVDIEQFCISRAELGAVIMEKRQSGVKMSVMIKVLDKDSIIRDEIISLIQAAYNTPLYHMRENKQRAVNEFSNKVLSKCLDIMEE